MADPEAGADLQSLLSVHSLHPKASDMTSASLSLAHSLHRPGLKSLSSPPTPELIRRLRAMTLKLLPVEVDIEVHPKQLRVHPALFLLTSCRVSCHSPFARSQLIAAPTSSIIHPGVVKSYAQAGGDFANAVPYALLMARASFIRCASFALTDNQGLCAEGADFSTLSCARQRCQVSTSASSWT